MLNFQDLFNSKRILVATFSKMCALTSRKYRGRNNARSTDMTSQILFFSRPEFYVTIDMTGDFFSLQQLAISVC